MDSLEKARGEINEIDRAMAELFERRMNACAAIGTYKREHGLPVRDAARETEITEKNSAYIKDNSLKKYYRRFLRSCIDISCEYQEEIKED